MGQKLECVIIGYLYDVLFKTEFLIRTVAFIYERINLDAN